MVSLRTPLQHNLATSIVLPIIKPSLAAPLQILKEIRSLKRSFETYLCLRLNRRFITQWPTVLAIVFEVQTGGQRKFDVPFEFEVRETEAHSAISFGLIACIKRSNMPVQGHSTTFVLSAADDDGWKV
jgi:hypothetical protein